MEDLPPVTPPKTKTSQKDLLDKLIHYACEVGVSDIHIDPAQDFMQVHVRVNGIFKLYESIDISVHAELIGRIKILAKLRTDVHDKGQDGRFEYIYVLVDPPPLHSFKSSERVDIRVSILPTFYGENAVLRILRPEKQSNLSFENLGMTARQIEDLKQSLNIQKGIIIVAGPTGSGKTTTIYTIIKHLMVSGLQSIVTIEDPVEYIISGIRQIQVSERSDFGFAYALRSILRQDPDVIVIGELRDADTAKLAFQAALTGHMVITSIHAEDSAGVCSRLRDLGVSNDSLHYISSIVSQRLVSCADDSHARVGIFEVLRMSGKIKLAIMQKSFPEYIRLTLRNNGALLLRDHAESLVSSGYISTNSIDILPC